MGWAEKHGSWRACWRDPGGKVQTKSGFKSRKTAERYAQDQEADIRRGTYTDPQAGQITLTAWVNRWYPAQDLELNTLSTYKYSIEVHILPVFGDRKLASLTPEEIAVWERQTVARGYTRKTAREARSLLATILSDAMPRYIQQNPAALRRGKGRRGQHRIERAEKAEKTWATPLEVLLFAERCAVLSGDETDFVMAVAMAYTGMRWSEALGLRPECVHGETLDIDWKLYELHARFYQGRPKDGSIRTVDVPPFLAELLEQHKASRSSRCTCSNPEPPWCPGDSYMFLAPAGAHFRRSNYSTRIVRPAADGWYLARGGPQPRAASPVLADMSGAWPGVPKPPWPRAQPGVPYQPPAGRGVHRLAGGKEGWGRCAGCGRTIKLRLDGTIGRHKTADAHCTGTGAAPADPMALVSWLPVSKGLTPHGLRHGHQTWLDDLGIRYVLQSERMGHEVPGMRGVYSHITPRMRAELAEGLQGLWEESLRQRDRLARASVVPVLDQMLARQREPGFRVCSHSAPISGVQRPQMTRQDREAGS